MGSDAETRIREPITLLFTELDGLSQNDFSVARDSHLNMFHRPGIFTSSGLVYTTCFEKDKHFLRRFLFCKIEVHESGRPLQICCRCRLQNLNHKLVTQYQHQSDTEGTTPKV